MEVHHRGPLDLVRAPLVFVRYRACFLLEGERYWEIFLGFARSCTKPPILVTRMEPHGMPVVLTCLFLTLVGTGLSWLYCMWMMEAIGRRWYCDSFNVGLPGPTAPAFQAVGYCDRKRVRFAVKTSGLSPQALRWTISIPYHQQHVFWLGVHKLECMGKLECMDVSGLDFPVRGISL